MQIYVTHSRERIIVKVSGKRGIPDLLVDGFAQKGTRGCAAFCFLVFSADIYDLDRFFDFLHRMFVIFDFDSIFFDNEVEGGKMIGSEGPIDLSIFDHFRT